ncbi:type II toxin-antitoxin system VapC family toxin [Lacunimicrobium album]
MVLMKKTDIFIDTNVLVFASIPTSPLYQLALSKLKTIKRDGQIAWISRQVIREYLVQITRPGILNEPWPAKAMRQVDSLSERFQIADETSEVTQQLLNLLSSGIARGKQIHDAAIVATCLSHGISTLLTHNVSDFQRYRSYLKIEGLT